MRLSEDLKNRKENVKYFLTSESFLKNCGNDLQYFSPLYDFFSKNIRLVKVPKMFSARKKAFCELKAPFWAL